MTRLLDLKSGLYIGSLNGGTFLDAKKVLVVNHDGEARAFKGDGTPVKLWQSDKLVGYQRININKHLPPENVYKPDTKPVVQINMEFIPLDQRVKLCYVEPETDSPRVFFTTRDLKDQWGDDWNDAPYEHNAGHPYTWHASETNPKQEYDIYVMRVWKNELKDPADIKQPNSWISVDRINDLEQPWLLGRGVAIWAGTTAYDFLQLLEKGGGKVVEELKLEPRR